MNDDPCKQIEAEERLAWIELRRAKDKVKQLNLFKQVGEYEDIKSRSQPELDEYRKAVKQAEAAEEKYEQLKKALEDCRQNINNA